MTLSFFFLLFFACDTSTPKDSNPNGGGDSAGTDSQVVEDTGTNLTCDTTNEDCGPQSRDCRGSGPTMLPGADCISCHTRGGPGEGTFTIAGTVFTNKYGIDPLNNATIRVTDSTGKVVTLRSNTVGNFLANDTVTPPLSAEVEVDGQIRAMSTTVDTGACNSCHQCDGSAEGKIAGPQ